MCHPKTHTRWLVHLSVNHDRVGQNSGLFHLVPEVVSFPCPFSNAYDYRKAFVELCYVVDKLLHENRLTNSRTTKETYLSTLNVWLKQVHHLNTCFKYLHLCGLLFKGWWFSKHRPVFFCVYGSRFIYRLTHHVEYPTKSWPTYWHFYGSTKIFYFLTSHESVSCTHCHTSDSALSYVLGYFKIEVFFRPVASVIYKPSPCLETVPDGWEVFLPKFYVNDRTYNLHYSSLHVCLLYFMASTAFTMSISSEVMDSCLALLNMRVHVFTSSSAFLVALSMATIRAKCSAAFDSSIAL